MKISVLGCGWLGLPLAAELVRRGHAVRGSVTHADKLGALAAAGIQGHRLELSPALTGDAAEFFDADVLIITLPPKRREPEVETRYPAQIAAALAETPEDAQIILTGSTSVYPELGRVVTEADAGGSAYVSNGNVSDSTTGSASSNATSISASGRAILAAEQLLHERGGTVLRLAGLYGYDRQPGRRLAGKDVSGGDARVNLVHRDDVLRAVVGVLEANLRGVTLNVCAPEHPTRREVYTRQAKRLGLAPPNFTEPRSQGYKLVSSEALVNALGFTFLYSDPLADAP